MVLLSCQNRKKVLSVERNLTYSEFLDKSRDVFGLARSQPVFLQRFDQVWRERVDVGFNRLYSPGNGAITNI